ncbi:MAG TPA: YXWGXW repeat-containing protein, partial [Gemmatales bacterium]|nr:YXWGXW repeat-containing protein [Gemmatales bacterium]
YDPEKTDFIWVSGFWRNAPPGRVWSAGEWRLENGQHRYIPGYWKSATESSWRVDLPEPPASVEAGPNVPARHEDAIWIPGHWVHRGESYVWRPGYWAEVEDNMVWMPGQYVYTGNGYRFVNGYWDYCLEDRGLLFAPVTFTSPLWLNPGWAFRPCFGINIGFGGGWGWGWGGFYNNLYMGPGFGNFWFGNFCNPWCWGAGFRPWCWNGARGFANPIFNHYCWLNRGNPGWRNNVQQTFAARQFGVIPGVNRQVGGTFADGGRQFRVNENTLNNATALARRIGGERAALQLADRVNKGAAIQQVNTALRQTNSPNLVQPASEVLRNQRLAQNLPQRPTASERTAGARPGTADVARNIRNAAASGSGNALNRDTGIARGASNSRPSLAASSDAQLRNQINNAIRNAPAGSISRPDINRTVRATTGNSGNSSTPANTAS